MTGSPRAMPELREVESLRRILVRTAVGRTILSVRIGEKRLRRRVTADFGGTVAGRRIVKLSRRAKYLIVELDGDHVLLVHLGMSGSLTHRHDGFDAGEFNPHHDHLEFSLDDGSRLVYNDPRRVGMVRLGGRTAWIKNLIMYQRIVAGVGNIYASEILFRAGVRPTRRAGRVTRSELEKIAASVPVILRAAIGSNGTTFCIYRDSRVRPRGRTVLHMLDADQERGRGPAREFLLPEMPALT